MIDVVRLLFWKLLLFIQPQIYNLDLPSDMSIHLVHHLPRLVAMVVKFPMCDKGFDLLFLLLFY